MPAFKPCIQNTSRILSKLETFLPPSAVIKRANYERIALYQIRTQKIWLIAGANRCAMFNTQQTKLALLCKLRHQRACGHKVKCQAGSISQNIRD